MAKKAKTSPYFPILIEHIDKSWVERRSMNYPFSGRDFRDLKNLSRNLMEWGLMALWDCFMESDNDWVAKSGYSVGAFTRCIPWLIDHHLYKERSRNYRDYIEKLFPTDEKVAELFACVNGRPTSSV